jgi:transcriptional regulator with XRE-family HTH domain
MHKMESKMKRSAKLKALIFDRGLTASEVAKRANLPASYLSLAIHGRFNLTEQEKSKIAEVLDTSPDQLFGFQETPTGVEIGP